MRLLAVEVGLRHQHKHRDDAECGAGPRSEHQCPGVFTFPNMVSELLCRYTSTLASNTIA